MLPAPTSKMAKEKGCASLFLSSKIVFRCLPVTSMLEMEWSLESTQ